MAAWFVDPNGVLTYMNQRAQELLGREARDSLGRPCHEVVGGIGATGEAVCMEVCNLRRRARCGQEHQIEPLVFRRVAGRAPEDWILVFPIVMQDPDGWRPYALHLAHSMRQVRRIQDYFESFLPPDAMPPTCNSPRGLLSPREREILGFLARGKDLKRIARELFISHATVRNHVQHILRNLGVHSIQEAVARDLLSYEQPGGATPELP